MIRRAVAVFACVLLALSVGGAASAAVPTPLKILAIGDSLNSGYGSPDGCGYRTELTRLLEAPLGANFDAVWTGPQRSGAAVGPNDCPYGFRHGHVVQDLRDRTISGIFYPGIETWMASDDPDVVIILTGTNNAAGSSPGMTGFGAAYRDLVQRIYTAKPTVKVVVTWIPYSAAPWAGNEVTVNIDIYNWVLAYFPQVIWVNLAQYPTRLMFDGLHPSDYGPIARLIYAALATAYGLPVGPQDSYALTTANCRPGIERAPTAITC